MSTGLLRVEDIWRGANSSVQSYEGNLDLQEFIRKASAYVCKRWRGEKHELKRLAWLLIELELCSYHVDLKEVAEALNISAGTLRSVKSRLHNELHKVFPQYYF